MKGCLPQILFGPLFNTFTHLLVSSEIFALKTLTTVFCNSKVIFGYFKGDLRPKLHACIYDILLILCIEKENCTKFCGVLISINKVIKLQSFAVDASDVIPANVQNISLFLFYIFNFMEYEPSTKFYGIFDRFSVTYRESYEVLNDYTVSTLVTSSIPMTIHSMSTVTYL